MLDIRDGLRWVRENIQSFGGDPSNVMIFGESGGGAKTSCLYAMPSAAPYFNKASIESGPGIRMMPREAAAETTLMVLNHLDREKRLARFGGSCRQAVGSSNGHRPSRGGPLGMNGGRKGMAAVLRPGGFDRGGRSRFAAPSIQSGSACDLQGQASDGGIQPR
jgi:para-nitrobenzyl esterase